MRLARRRLAATVVTLVVLAGCGGDADDDADVVSEGSTSTEETTTAPDATDDPSTTETTAPSTSGGGEGTGTPDTEAAEVTWGSTPSELRGQDGLLVAYDCPPNVEDAASTVWGTGTYTDDSSVCTAAVHAGLITPDAGGRVVIEIAPGQDSYTGSEANGVSSLDYGVWDGSFTFPAS